VTARGGGAEGTLASVTRRGARHLRRARSLFYRPRHSVLAVASDEGGWVLDDEARAIAGLASRLGIRAEVNLPLSAWAAQCCHYTSQFVLLAGDAFRTRQRVSLDFLHGRPADDPVFAQLHDSLRRHHGALTRVRVSHRAMEDAVRASGIAAEKVHRIPLGIDLAAFPPQTAARRADARRRLELPESAVVIGSFQKDGVGWGEGLEPKKVKGPDVFLEAMAALRPRVRELWVLLTGPARGYVKNGLERLGIPFRHEQVSGPGAMGQCYQALDAYVVSSRDEGGPKAVLEAMASGVPLITTRVGQAVDLVVPGRNGWMVDVEDAEGLAHAAEQALTDRERRDQVVAAAQATAGEHSYDAQVPQWAEFFRGYVEGW
jgi:glycosyltransferase involved in cell wall biosynthesis